VYGKIFDSIYDGTLVEDWRALVTFQQMIILSDSQGTIDITPRALSRRTGIPIEHIEAGIHVLESPDPYSRSPEEEGRRIVRLDSHRDWGWKIVNHSSYRNMKDHEDRRDYKRRKQKEYDAKAREKSNKNNTPLDKKVQNNPEMSSSVSVYVFNKYKGVDKKAWIDFEEHRNEIKKPLTEKAADLAAAKLNALTPKQQQKIVNKSIECRWTGLFPNDKEIENDPAKGAI